MMLLPPRIGPSVREKLWVLKLLRVNSKPVLHRPVEIARFYGKLAEHISKQKSTFEDVSMLEPSDAKLA
jgi:hypothetical protein